MNTRERKRLLRSVAREIEALVKRLGWKVVYRCISGRWGSVYLRLALPGCERGRHAQAAIRVADHAKPAGPDEKRYDWILHQHWGKPLTDLRAFLWARLRDSLDRPPKPMRPILLPPVGVRRERFDVKAYLATRQAQRSIVARAVRVDRVAAAATVDEPAGLELVEV